MNNIKYDDLLDKIHGCWYGKCLGGAAGAQTEALQSAGSLFQTLLL